MMLDLNVGVFRTGPINKTSTQRENSIQLSPPPGWIKINFNGAMKGNPGLRGYGGLIRDDMENCLIVVVIPIGVQTNHVMEAMDLLQTLKIIKKEMAQNVWIEGDSTNILKCINKITKPSWSIKAIIKEARIIIKSFKKVIISHAYQEVNCTTDELAKFAIKDKDIMIWHRCSNLTIDMKAKLAFDRSQRRRVDWEHLKKL